MRNEDGFLFFGVVGAVGMFFLFGVCFASCEAGRDGGRAETCRLVCRDADAEFDAGRGCGCVP